MYVVVDACCKELCVMQLVRAPGFSLKCDGVACDNFKHYLVHSSFD